MGGIGDDSGVLFSRSRAVIWKDRHDPFGNMAFACLCGAPSLIVISKCSKTATGGLNWGYVNLQRGSHYADLNVVPKEAALGASPCTLYRTTPRGASNKLRVFDCLSEIYIYIFSIGEGGKKL